MARETRRSRLDLARRYLACSRRAEPAALATEILNGVHMGKERGAPGRLRAAIEVLTPHAESDADIAAALHQLKVVAGVPSDPPQPTALSRRMAEDEVPTAIVRAGVTALRPRQPDTPEDENSQLLARAIQRLDRGELLCEIVEDLVPPDPAPVPSPPSGPLDDDALVEHRKWMVAHAAKCIAQGEPRQDALPRLFFQLRRLRTGGGVNFRIEPSATLHLGYVERTKPKARATPKARKKRR